MPKFTVLYCLSYFLLNCFLLNFFLLNYFSSNHFSNSLIKTKRDSTTEKITEQLQQKPTYTISYNKQYGFSFVELTIVIAILSVLLSTAIPNFKTIIDKSKLSSTSSELITSLSLARQYAITSGKKTHICALISIEPIQCSQQRNFNANWSQGWMVFADINNNNEYDSKDTVLNISPYDKKINIIFNQRGRLRFFPNGSARSAGFYICNKNSLDNRHVKLLYSGRARTSKITNPNQLATCLTAN